MNRVNNKDLEDAIYIPDSNESPKDSTTNIVYPDQGTWFVDEEGTVYQDEYPENTNIVASNSIGPKAKQYFVKVNRRNELFQPGNKFYQLDSVRFAKIQGLEPYVMIECNPSVHKLYLAYIQGNGNQSLLKAQQGI